MRNRLSTIIPILSAILIALQTQQPLIKDKNAQIIVGGFIVAINYIVHPIKRKPRKEKTND